MEMTGLDVEKEVPIEVAAIVTDSQFNDLGHYHAVFKQPQSYLDAMDDWNKRQHRETGLVDLIPGGSDPTLVDQELAAFIKSFFGAERAILSGNSISQDRLFIRRYMPLTEATLHYRMLDVTSWKVLYNELFDLKFKKKDGHRALDDIRESIAEMKFYLSFVQPRPV
ncbi:MAG: oligoribonuclease [Bdellovibrionales bacterium]|nr:oligoribonuclease [Bdellovibrionales bacterium]